MSEKMYNTYSFGEDLTFFEIDKKNIKGKEYLLLLQKQEPNLIMVGYFENEKLEIVKNKVIYGELMKCFDENNETIYEKLKPFIDFSKKAKA